MKIAFIADVHLGNHRVCGGKVVSGVNTRARKILNVLKRAMAVAMAEAAEMVVVCGDLFDHTRPEPQLITEVLGAGPVLLPKVCLVGNHDCVSTDQYDHALGPLNHHRRGWFVSSLPQDAYLDAVTLIRFDPAPASEYLPEAIAKVATPAIAIHAGVSDERTPTFLRGAHDAIPAEKLAEVCAANGVTHVFAGNWHDHRAWEIHGVKIIQVGALVPTGWDNPSTLDSFMFGAEADPYGSVIVWDTDLGACRRHVVPGPRFIRTSDAAGAAAVAQSLEGRSWPGGLGYDLYIRLETTTDDAAIKDLPECLQQCAAIQLLPPSESATARVVGGGGADSVGDAVARYCQSAPRRGGWPSEAYAAAVTSRISALRD